MPIDNWIVVGTEASGQGSLVEAKTKGNVAVSSARMPSSSSQIDGVKEQLAQRTKQYNAARPRVVVKRYASK